MKNQNDENFDFKDLMSLPFGIAYICVYIL